MTTHAEKIASLPQYRSHKVVRAARILEVEPLQYSHLVLDGGDGTGLRKVTLAISTEWLARHNPQTGGYLVVYEDGYSSYSPAAAFVEGYSLIQQTTESPTQSAG